MPDFLAHLLWLAPILGLITAFILCERMGYIPWANRPLVFRTRWAWYCCTLIWWGLLLPMVWTQVAKVELAALTDFPTRFFTWDLWSALLHMLNLVILPTLYWFQWRGITIIGVTQAELRDALRESLQQMGLSPIDRQGVILLDSLRVKILVGGSGPLGLGQLRFVPKRGEDALAGLLPTLRQTFHANSNTPARELRLAYGTLSTVLLFSLLAFLSLLLYAALGGDVARYRTLSVAPNADHNAAHVCLLQADLLNKDMA